MNGYIENDEHNAENNSILVDIKQKRLTSTTLVFGYDIRGLSIETEGEVIRMNAFKIQEMAETFADKQRVMSGLEKRLISIGSNDFEQEEILLQRLDQLSEASELILDALQPDGFLSMREIAALDLRLDGYTLEQIGSVFCITKERVRQILQRVYEKIATVAEEG